MHRNDTLIQLASGLGLILTFGLAVLQIRTGLQAQNIVLDWGIFAQPSSLTSGTYATTIFLGILTTWPSCSAPWSG